MKALLVIDVDDNIDVENTQATYVELQCDNHTTQISLINHWLKPMPQKKEIIRWDKKKYPRYVDWCEHLKDLSSDEKHESIKNEGFNECIDEILGGE